MTKAMLNQFNELKSKHPDTILLFRCGDFYESYENDAEVVSKVLGIVLTTMTGIDIKMAGFPHYSLDMYLPKLIRAGKRVAICDQLEPLQPPTKVVKSSKLAMPALSKKQYELLCECIRYRCADNSREMAEAIHKKLSTKFYEAKSKELEALKKLLYDKTLYTLPLQ